MTNKEIAAALKDITARLERIEDLTRQAVGGGTKGGGGGVNLGSDWTNWTTKQGFVAARVKTIPRGAGTRIYLEVQTGRHAGGWVDDPMAPGSPLTIDQAVLIAKQAVKEAEERWG